MTCTCLACSVRDFFNQYAGSILLVYTILRALLLIYRQGTETTNLILDFRVRDLEKFVKNVREHLPDDFGDL